MQSYIEQRIDKSTGCWEWTASTNKWGYGNAWDGKTVQRAHRMAYEAYVAPIPDGLCVLHRCDNRKCVNPDHLFLGDRGDNARDMTQKGRRFVPKGEQSSKAKLTWDKVREIRSLVEQGWQQNWVAEAYGVTPTVVSNIKLRRTWKD